MTRGDQDFDQLQEQFQQKICQTGSERVPCPPSCGFECTKVNISFFVDAGINRVSGIEETRVVKYFKHQMNGYKNPCGPEFEVNPCQRKPEWVDATDEKQAQNSNCRQ